MKLLGIPVAPEVDPPINGIYMMLEDNGDVVVYFIDYNSSVFYNYS